MRWRTPGVEVSSGKGLGQIPSRCFLLLNVSQGGELTTCFGVTWGGGEEEMGIVKIQIPGPYPGLLNQISHFKKAPLKILFLF